MEAVAQTMRGWVEEHQCTSKGCMFLCDEKEE